MISPVPIDPDDWQIAAACRDEREMFFAPDAAEAKVERRRREARAKAICRTCRVRPECLDEALRAGERFGIWGGLTERERRSLQLGRQGARREGAGDARPVGPPVAMILETTATEPSGGR